VKRPGPSRNSSLRKGSAVKSCDSSQRRSSHGKEGEAGPKQLLYFYDMGQENLNSLRGLID